ncbi:hypothetical protein LSAT2_020027, partial [Lamellibrachia satsuma]
RVYEVAGLWVYWVAGQWVYVVEGLWVYEVAGLWVYEVAGLWVYWVAGLWVYEGSVVLEDGLPTMRQIGVRVEKTAESKERLSEITVKHALLDVSSIGMVLLLQLVSLIHWLS